MKTGSAVVEKVTADHLAMKVGIGAAPTTSALFRRAFVSVASLLGFIVAMGRMPARPR